MKELALVVMLLCLTTSVSAIKVLIVYNGGLDYYLDDTVQKLMNISYIDNVTLIAGSDTPTLEFMTNYDTVLITGGGSWPTAFGDNLAKYMATRGGVVIAGEYFDFRNDQIGGAFSKYNYLTHWYPSYDPSTLYKNPNNTNSYTFNTTSVIGTHYSMTTDQMSTPLEILFYIEYPDDDQPYLGIVTKTENIGGLKSVRTDMNFNIISEDVYPYGYKTPQTTNLIADTLLRAARPCVTACIPSFNLTASDTCTASYPPFACDTVVQNTVGQISGVGSNTLELKINGVTCSSIVNVVDLTPPVLTCPPPIEVTADYCTITVPQLALNSITDNCDTGIFVVTQSPAAGSELIIGTHTITMRAADMYGNVGSCQTQITVLNSEPYTLPPTLNCPAEYIVPYRDWDCYGIVQNYQDLYDNGNITAYDECGGTLQWGYHIYQSPFPEAPLINGSRIVIITVIDDYDNNNTCEILQRMVDRTPPTCGGVGPLRKRADLILDSECKAPVPLIETSYYDACWEASFEEWPYPALPYSQSPNATQYLYGPGTFNITTSATDLSGNTGKCFWEYVTADVTGPVLSCPDELSVTDLVPDFSDYVNATDNCGDLIYNQSIAISSLLSGTHNVTVTVSDLSGNSASCEISVIFEVPLVISPPSSGSSSDGGLSPGAIAGIVIGVLVGLCLLFGLAAFLIVKRRKRPDDNFFTVELVPATGDVAKSTGHFKAKN